MPDTGTTNTQDTKKGYIGSASHGIDLLTIALLDGQTGKVLTGADQGLSTNGLVAVDEGVQGATTVEYQNIETAGTSQFANNKKKRMTMPLQAPTANLTFLDIAWDVLNKLLGYEQGADGGYSLNQAGKPNFAMLTRTTAYDGSALYEAFATAQAIEPTVTHNTDNETEQDANISLTVNAYEPIADVFKLKNGKKMPYRRWSSVDGKFDAEAMMAQVFPGYTPDDLMTKIVPTYVPKNPAQISGGTTDNHGNSNTEGH